jgi:small subunit ribosomal protein S6
MAANVYECMFLLDTTKVAGDVPAAAKQITSLFERNEGEILASRPWDERRLAYPVKGQKKGLYYLIYVRTDGKNLINVERDIALNETILRSMFLRIEPKLVDTMLTLARDENALALQVASDSGDDATGGDEHRPPRGRRHHDKD